MAFGRKTKLILAGMGLAGLVAGWQGIRFWWYHGYSSGERTGFIRKMSVKGTPMCKYLEGELALRQTRSGRVEVTQMWGRPQSVREEFRRRRAQ